MANFRTPARPPDPPLDALKAILPAHLDIPNAVLAIAFSGGLDSTVLLHAALRYCLEHGTSLIAFHINHQLSPHATHWAHFCEYACGALDVPLSVRVITVKARASLEEAAREARYQALRELCEKHRVSVLLTAHHATDQAETVLFNLLRGTGPAGLRGIAPVLPFANGKLIRPFLELTRRQLEEDALRRELQWIKDESNDDLRFTRNALRHKVLPVLGEINPSSLDGLARSARHAASATDLLAQLAEIDFGHEPLRRGLSLARFRSLHKERQVNLLRYWLQQNHFGVLSEVAMNDWIMQLASGATDVRLTLAGQEFHIREGRLEPCNPDAFPGASTSASTSASSYVAASASSESPLACLEVAWQGESIIEVPSWRGRLQIGITTGPGISARRLAEQPLQLRIRGGGERVQVRKGAPSRSLKNLYQEAGIPPYERRWLPLVFCADELIFAAGLGMNLRACDHIEGGVALDWQSFSAVRM